MSTRRSIPTSPWLSQPSLARPAGLPGECAGRPVPPRTASRPRRSPCARRRCRPRTSRRLPRYSAPTRVSRSFRSSLTSYWTFGKDMRWPRPSRSPGRLDRPRAPAAVAAAAGPRCRWRRPGAGLRRLRLWASLGAPHRRAGQPAGCRRPPSGGAAAAAAAAEVATGPGKQGMASARDGRPRPLLPQTPRRRSRRRSGGSLSRRRHLRDAPHRTALAPVLAPALRLP
mmetsp:Transcript_74616/g.201317  ORF Transcript_74616/g.201317 Transcript_74616/m.201317 type:complete len:227 (+) Transcript_74616:1452-2132(+)